MAEKELYIWVVTLFDPNRSHHVVFCLPYDTTGMDKDDAMLLAKNHIEKNWNRTVQPIHLVTMLAQEFPIYL